MAGVKDDALARIGPWPKGVNNMAPEFAVPADQLRAALNVDIDDEGHLVTRPGFAKVVNATHAHSLWSRSAFPYALYVDNGQLIALDTNYTKTNLKTGFDNHLPLVYTTANKSAYFSNGSVNGRIDSKLNVRTWGVESPAGEPLLVANAIGGLDAGAYQVAVSYVSDEGEEGGTGLASTVTVAQSGGIQLSSIPQPAGSHITYVRIWLSPTNGDLLYWHSDVPVGTTSLLIGKKQLGKQLETQFLKPMPAGTVLRRFNARMYVAVGNVLFFSELYRFGLHNPTKYLTFPEPIVMVRGSREADIGGLYVGTNNGNGGGTTYFLRGADPDPKASGLQGFTRTSAYAAGVVPGSDTVVTGAELGLEGNVVDDDVPLWLATTGVFCVGLTDGNVEQISNDRLRLPQFARATSVYQEKASIRQVLFNMNGIGPQQNAAASDTVVATVTRNGITT